MFGHPIWESKDVSRYTKEGFVIPLQIFIKFCSVGIQRREQQRVCVPTEYIAFGFLECTALYYWAT